MQRLAQAEYLTYERAKRKGACCPTEAGPQQVNPFLRAHGIQETLAGMPGLRFFVFAIVRAPGLPLLTRLWLANKPRHRAPNAAYAEVGWAGGESDMGAS